MKDVEFTCWAIQYNAVRAGWWTVPSLIRASRADAIRAWMSIWDPRAVDRDRHWRRERDAGRVRCVKVRVISQEGREA